MIFNNCPSCDQEWSLISVHKGFSSIHYCYNCTLNYYNAYSSPSQICKYFTFNIQVFVRWTMPDSLSNTETALVFNNVKDTVYLDYLPFNITKEKLKKYLLFL